MRLKSNLDYILAGALLFTMFVGAMVITSLILSTLINLLFGGLS